MKLENKEIDFENKNEILNLNDFIKRQNHIDSYMQSCKFRRTNHIKLKEKVIRLQEILRKKFIKDIDPIVFLHWLYFDKNLSIESIVNYIKQIYDELWETDYFYKNSAALQKLFTQVLNWKLKNSKENKNTSEYKSREKPAQLIAKNQEEKDKRKALFLSWYIKNNTIDNTEFDINIFNSLKFKYEKFIYLLEKYFKISKKSYQELLNIDLWNQSFADRFNEIFKENNIVFEISPKDIARVFEKYK